MTRTTSRIKWEIGKAGLKAVRHVRQEPVKMMLIGLASGVALGLFPSARRSVVRGLGWLMKF